MSIPNHLAKIKSAGIYRFVWDKSVISPVVAETLRLVVGYSEKGPFNTPVYIEKASDFYAVFGNVSKKLERKGIYFHRLALQALAAGPILALNLKPFTPTGDDAEVVEWAAFDPAEILKGFVSKTKSISDLYDTNRFWYLDANQLPEKLNSKKYINIAHTDTADRSCSLIMRPVAPSEYNLTIREWYSTVSAEEMPAYLEPIQDELVSKYFADVYTFRGEFTHDLVKEGGPLGSYITEYDKDGDIVGQKWNGYFTAVGNDASTVFVNYTATIDDQKYDFELKYSRAKSLDKKFEAGAVNIDGVIIEGQTAYAYQSQYSSAVIYTTHVGDIKEFTKTLNPTTSNWVNDVKLANFTSFKYKNKLYINLDEPMNFDSKSINAMRETVTWGQTYYCIDSKSVVYTDAYYANAFTTKKNPTNISDWYLLDDKWETWTYHLSCFDDGCYCQEKHDNGAFKSTNYYTRIYSNDDNINSVGCGANMLYGYDINLWEGDKLTSVENSDKDLSKWKYLDGTDMFEYGADLIFSETGVSPSTTYPINASAIIPLSETMQNSDYAVVEPGAQLLFATWIPQGLSSDVKISIDLLDPNGEPWSGFDNGQAIVNGNKVYKYLNLSSNANGNIDISNASIKITIESFVTTGANADTYEHIIRINNPILFNKGVQKEVALNNGSYNCNGNNISKVAAYTTAYTEFYAAQTNKKIFDILYVDKANMMYCRTLKPTKSSWVSFVNPNTNNNTPIAQRFKANTWYTPIIKVNDIPYYLTNAALEDVKKGSVNAGGSSIDSLKPAYAVHSDSDKIYYIYTNGRSSYQTNVLPGDKFSNEKAIVAADWIGALSSNVVKFSQNLSSNFVAKDFWINPDFKNSYGETIDALEALANDSSSNFVQSYRGCLIPYFKDGFGTYVSLDTQFNLGHDSHNMLMKFDETILDDVVSKFGSPAEKKQDLEDILYCNDVYQTTKVYQDIEGVSLDDLNKEELYGEILDYLPDANEEGAPLNCVVGNIPYILVTKDPGNIKLRPQYLKGYTYKTIANGDTGIKLQNKILKMLDDKGIRTALTNRVDVEYHYIVDTFQSYVTAGCKSRFAALAKEKDNAFAILNCPPMSEFVNSGMFNSNNKFDISKVANARYGFSLPSENEGASHCGFFTGLNFSDGTLKYTVPSAAIVSNNFMKKYDGSLKPYHIIAGPIRGLVSYSGMVGPDYNYGRSDLDVLEPLGVNAIIYVPRKGVYINSNQTAKQTPVSALSKIHIRELVTYIQNEIENMLQNYQWELNTQSLRDTIKTNADYLLGKIMADGGIYAYSTVCDSTNNTPDIIDNEMLVLDIAIEPARGAGKMVQQLTIHKTGGITSTAN